MSNLAAEPLPVRASRREWAGLTVLALPTLLVSMDFTLLHLAVPELSADLRPDASQLLWITDIYGFLLAGFLIPMGTLGDRIGLRRILLAGAAAFGGASVLAALAPTSASLIAMRGALGIAGATLIPSTLSLIRQMFHDDDQRRVAISVWMTTFMLGSASGPLVGGVLLSYFWWGSVFLVGVVAMLLFLVLGRTILPEFANPDQKGSDVPSVLFALVSMLTFIYGVKRLAQQELDAGAIGSVVGGLLVGALFVHRQRSVDRPVIDLRMFRSTSFSLAFAIQLLTVFTFTGTFFFVAQYLQLVIGLTPLQAGLWILPATLAGILGVLVTPSLAARVPAGRLVGAGLAVAAAGFCLLTRTEPGSGPALVLAGLGLVYVGMAPPSVVITDVILSSAPRARAGMASAMSETSHELGGALGIAILGSLGALVYRQHLPSATGTEDAHAGTLAEALAAAARLSGPAALRAREGALDAFSRALEVTAGVSAAIVALLALAAILLLPVRRTRTP